MPSHLVQELLQAKSSLLDELRLEDAVVVGEEGKLLGEGLAGAGTQAREVHAGREEVHH